jgi:adenylate kinase
LGLEIIFLGCPGAGKGMHSDKLSRDYGIPHISTGDMLRENIRSGTPLGIEAKTYMDRGQLVPDSVVVAMVNERVHEPDSKKGFLLDGFPRTPEQAEEFSNLLAKDGRSIRLVLYLRTSRDVVLKRLTGRRICDGCGKIYNIPNFPPRVEGVCDKCGGIVVERKDDSLQTILNRLEVYERQTVPLIAYYGGKGLLTEIPCDRLFSEAHADLDAIFRKLVAEQK